MNNYHEATGSITAKQLRKVYHKDSDWYGNSFYRLTTKIEGKSKEEYFFVYPNLVRVEIFRTIERTKYVDKRYLLFYEKRKKRLVLRDWRELEKEKDHE